jgi:hypothetical protein
MISKPTPVMNSLLFLALAASSSGQTQDPTSMPAPELPVGGPLELEATDTTVAGQPLDPSSVVRTWTQSMAEAAERSEAEPPVTELFKTRGDRQGVWHTPGVKHKWFTNSGRGLLFNKWGDTSMGIDFGARLTLKQLHVASQGGRGSWAEAIRIVGFLGGEEVGKTAWFDDIDEDPDAMTVGLGPVDRIVVEAKPSSTGHGFYALDDLVIVDETGERRVLDFEDAPMDANLTGSDYLGFTWEQGTGSFDAPDATAVSPPVWPGSIVPVTPTGGGSAFGSSLGSATAPTPLQDFQGPRIFEPGAGFIPPDTSGAAGLAHYVACVNANLSVYEKGTGNRVVNVSFTSFFNSGPIGDVRVAYDFADNRWALLATDFNNNIVLAYSETSDPTGSWFMAEIRLTLPSTTDGFVDFPTLGVDSRGIFVGAFLVNQPSFAIFAIDKAPLLQSNQSLGAVTAFRDLPTEGAIQHATQYTDAGASYMVSAFFNPSITIRRINEPLSNPTLTTTLVTGIPNFDFPPNAPSMGSTTDISTGDTRLVNAVFAGGSIWTSHAVDVNGRAGARWYEIDPFTATLLQTGTVSDPTLAYFYPSIAADANGNVVMGFSGTSDGQFVGAYSCGRISSDPAGEMSTPVQYSMGLGSYTRVDGGGRNRWGDYSQTSLDPVDGTFWTIQERAIGSNNWGTRIQQLEYDVCEGAITRYCTSTSGPLGLPVMIFPTSGSTTSVSANNLGLVATNLNTGAFGLFYFGPNQASTPLGEGVLCVGNPFSRLPVVQADASGAARLDIDLTNLPPGSPTIQVGDTFNFSFWFRQVSASGFNFSDALEIQFCD